MKSPLNLEDLAEREITIQAPWGKLAALSWGDASLPPVLLVHGKLDVCSGFRPLVALLPRAFHYVGLDCPGNGKSDPFPANARFTTVDYVPAVVAVREHFHWDRFIYIGHSLGAVIGKYFNLAYPGVVRRMVELDPVPAYDAWPPDSFGAWYHVFYGDYYRADRYVKYNGSVDTAPKYTYEKALEMMVNARGLTESGARHVLDRALSPAGDGLYRFTFDQRQKEIPRLPLSAAHLREMYSRASTPTLCVVAQASLDMGAYQHAPFALDAAAWPRRNHTPRAAPGGHDLHITHPERIADMLAHFLLDEYKAKL